jgi:hypothetical protein
MSEEITEAAELTADPEEAAQPDAGTTGSAVTDAGVTGVAGVAAERDRLARLLRETRLQLTMTQARLSALEQSSTLELGRTLVRAARRPWPRGAQLPRDLYRMWRGASGGIGAGQAAPAASPAMLALASAQLGDLAGGGERLLSALSAPGLSAPGLSAASGPGLVVTGVLTSRACATLGPDAAVHPLLPHDADILLESCGADLVLIQASALLATSPWAYAVDPAGADRGRRLARLIAAARALGKPVIFIRDIPPHLAPGLDWVTASCDVVTDDGLGVQLSLFNPIGRTLAPDGRPVYAGVRDPRESPALRALLDAVTGDGAPPVTVTGEVPWRRLPELYRSHSLFLAVSPDQALAQRACGARVIMASGEPADLARRLAEAAADSPPDGPEITGWLRDVYETGATAARLGALAELAGLGAESISGRRIAVLAQAGDAAAARELGVRVRRQRLRPAELVVCAGDSERARRSVAAALDDLPGVQVIGHAGDDWLRACAARTRAPWAAPWDASREVPATYLLDLACALECSRADAVGAGRGAYQYTTFLESPGLARRELLGTGGLDISQGLRLFSASGPTQLGAQP